ncbi:MAG TPA: Ig-like domain-containing protein [Pyrinomonadaceae bacterium]|nr:Ig-like domain-containing protein [Pyrinomonadaceae bacterium]
MFQQALTAFCLSYLALFGALAMDRSRSSEMNQPPVAVDDTYTVHGPSQLTPGVAANDFDPEGGPLVVSQVITPVQHGQLTNLGQNNFSYFPNFGFTGEDSFVYQICDALGGCSTARVILNVVNQPPIAMTDVFTVHGDTTLGNLMENDSDPEGDPVSIVTLVTFPAHGTLTGLTEPGVFRYRPEPHFIGSDSFSYRLCDRFGACSVGVVTLVVVNNAPIAQGETYIIRDSTKIGPMLGNDQDPDAGDKLDFVLTEGASHGTVFGEPEPGFATYRPNIGYEGIDSFLYKVCDQLLLCSDPVTVLLVIIPNDGAEDMGESCPNQRVALPVNVANGNMYMQQRDYALPGAGPGIDVARTYNSLSDRSGIFGRGWSTQYDETLVVYDPSFVRLIEEDGRVTNFVRNDEGILLPLERDFHGRIIQNADLSYTLSLKDGETHNFSGAGKLLSINDLQGNQTTLSYDSTDHLMGITDSVGRAVQVTSDSAGRVVEISDAMGSIATYSYGVNNELLAVTYLDGSRFTFSYVASPRLLLATVTDALGNVVESHSYDSQGRATTSAKHDNVELVTLNYVSTSQTNVMDAEGHTTRYFFDTDKPRDVVTRVEGFCNCDTGSQVQTWTHDADLNVLTHTNARGQVTSYTFDERGNQLTATDNLGTVRMTYNEFGQVLTSSDLLGNVARREYDEFGNLIQFIDPLNNVTSFNYDSAGRLLTVTDARQGITQYTYDSAGNVIQHQDSLGNIRTFDYDFRGRLLTATDPLNNVTAFNYDPFGRLTKLTHPDGSSVSLTYDLAGRRTKVTDAGGNSTTYSYDGAYRLRARTDALSNVRNFTYDLNSNLVAATDELGRTTSFEYDEFRRVTRVIFPAANSESERPFETINYDELGNVTSRKNRAGRVTQFEYDESNRLIKIIDPGQQTTRFEYDERSQTAAVADALGQRYNFAYDQLGRLVSIQRGQLSRSYSYDAVGNRVRRTDFNGQVTKYRYDKLNRLRRIIYPDLSTVRYRYDALSRLQVAENVHGRITFEYDNRSRLISTLDVLGRSVSYTYDANSNRLSMALGSTVDATYEYDALNRLTRIVEAAGGKANSFSYDPTGKLALRVLGNAVTTSFEYDGLNRLIRLRDFKGNSVLADHRYSFDAADNLIQDIESVDASSYTYDAMDRLTAMLSGSRGESYSYDSLGNRTASHLSPTYTHGPFNQLTSSTTSQLNYDGNGNVISKTDASGSAHYVWDFENRLVQATNSSGHTVVYKYDALGRRFERSSASGATRFLHDGLDVIKDLNSDRTVQNYLNGPGIDNKLRQRGSGDSFYYLRDHLGNTRMLTDNKGRVVERLSYDSFGNILQSSGGSVGSVNTRYDFTGRERDPLTGLIYYRARWYDPHLGRFISEDPLGLGGGLNQYSYVGNNPLNKRDPFGLYEIDVHYYLTYYLAIHSGCFNDAEAREIANATQGVDEQSGTQPGYGGHVVLLDPRPNYQQQQINIDYHALHRGSHQPYLDWHWRRALSGNNLGAIGAYLHYLQDTFSHDGFTDPLYGHSPAHGGTHVQDKTDADPSKALKMARATFYELRRFAREKLNRCTCNSDVDWNAVARFARAPGGNAYTRHAHSIQDVNPSYLSNKIRILNVPRR